MPRLIKIAGSNEWYSKIRLGPYQQRKARFCTDRGTSETWHRALQAAVDRNVAGEPPRPEVLALLPQRLLKSFGIVPSPTAQARRGTWAENVRAYIDELRTAGRDERYIKNAETTLTAVGKACGWRRLADADRDGLLTYLSSRKGEGRAPRTLKNDRAVIAGFTAWAVEAKRLDADPLGKLPAIDTSADQKRHRRALTEDEVARLLNVAGRHELLYRVALATGLRLGELRRLEWQDVHLDSTRPRLELRSAATKSKRADTLPLSGALAERLRKARPTGVKPRDRVFRTVPSFDVWLTHCERAGILCYDEEDVLVVGFHSLRVTFVSDLTRAGVNPRTIMELARHTDYRLTATVYTDPTILDTFGAVGRLPKYEPNPKPEASEERWTGTDDQPIRVQGANPPDSDQIRDQMAFLNVHSGASESNTDVLVGYAENATNHEENDKYSNRTKISPSRTRTYNNPVNSRVLYH